MIQVYVKNFKEISSDDTQIIQKSLQRGYDTVIAALSLNNLVCDCDNKGCFIYYGRYVRHFKFKGHLIEILIQRVFCNKCGRTHALLVTTLVPYSQVILSDHRRIVAGDSPADIMSDNPLIDYDNIKSIKRQFSSHWKNRLLKKGLSVLNDDLVNSCFLFFSLQFMQIHQIKNLLIFPSPT